MLTNNAQKIIENYWFHQLVVDQKSEVKNFSKTELL